MPEHHDRDHDRKVADKKSVEAEEKADIIELSDIAVGTSQEDDAIIELTEELIGEAMNGITGVTVDYNEEELLIDLSSDSPVTARSSPDMELHDNEPSGPDEDFPAGKREEKATDVDDHLEKELDDFFGKEPETLPETEPKPETKPQDSARPVVAAPEQELLAALEIMVRNKYGDRIHHMIVAAIDRIIAEELDRIKKNITESLKS